MKWRGTSAGMSDKDARDRVRWRLRLSAFSPFGNTSLCTGKGVCMISVCTHSFYI